MAKKKIIILGVTGSIAAYRAGEIIRRLQDAGHDVQVVMTEAAEAFVTPLTFEALSGNRVLRDMFVSNGDTWSSNHIALADKADLLLIAPATANIIGKIAHGIADDLLTCVAMATQAPIAIAPAMNSAMYRNAIVQDNIKRLKKTGVTVIDPTKGKLACGTSGPGHLAEIADIVKKSNSLLRK